MLFTRVRPAIRVKAQAAADARGVSVAVYVEQLLARDIVDDHGRPVWSDEQQTLLPEEGLRLSRSA